MLSDNISSLRQNYVLFANHAQHAQCTVAVSALWIYLRDFPRFSQLSRMRSARALLLNEQSKSTVYTNELIQVHDGHSLLTCLSTKRKERVKLSMCLIN
jgi:hypothetical protein